VVLEVAVSCLGLVRPGQFSAFFNPGVGNKPRVYTQRRWLSGDRERAALVAPGLVMETARRLLESAASVPTTDSGRTDGGADVNEDGEEQRSTLSTANISYKRVHSQCGCQSSSQLCQSVCYSF